jgi:hypothetical protein
LQPSDFGPDVLGAATTLAEGPVGFYSVGGLATPGTFTVTFQKEGFLLATATAALAPNGNETNLSPILQPVTGVVAGVVTQAVIRNPPCEPLACRLPEAQVKVTDRNGSEVRNVTTASSPDANLGRYEIAGLAAGTYTITFSKDGYIAQTFSVTLSENEPVRTLDVTLRGAAVTISGSAPNCTGVEVLLRSGRPLDPPVSAPVRADGSYRISKVPSPGEYRMAFSPAGAPLSIVDVTLDAGETGTVVDGSCAPSTTTCVVAGVLCTKPPTTP